MKTRCEPVYIGTQGASVMRVVHDRKNDASLGIQTGVVHHRHYRIPVWRPANPRALGLDRSWRDGHWRNIFEIDLHFASIESDELYSREIVEVCGCPVYLPVAQLVKTKALRRYVRQQSR